MQTFKFNFTVDRIVFRNAINKYSIVIIRKFKPHDKSIENKATKITVKGYFVSLQEGDTFEGTGYWIEDPKYGWQINLESATTTIPSSIKGIKRFLIRFVPNIGPVIADRIIDKFGLNTIDAIKNNSDVLFNIKGVGKKKAISIAEAIKSHDELEKLTLFLFQNGITNFLDVIKIYDKLQGGAVNKLLANPYILCKELSPQKLFMADSIAINMGLPADNIERLTSALLYVINTGIYSNGHTFIYKDCIYGNLNYFLKNSPYQNISISNQQIDKAFGELVKNKELVIEKDINGRECIYTPSMAYAENYIVNSVLDLVSRNIVSNLALSDVRKFLTIFEKQNNVSVNNKQSEAIVNSATSMISILSGGPGTGKTFTINATISYLYFKNPQAKILLAAPTGRAAKRMTEMTGMEAQTIHKLLGIRKDEPYAEEEAEPIDADFIIVDEFSMVDIFLMEKLIKAVKKSNIPILLAGDYKQLPSVGPGLVLRDLILSGIVPTVILTELYRQDSASQIAINSQKIDKGETDLVYERSKQDFLMINQTTIEGIQKKLVDSILYLKNNRFSLSDILVLAPVNKGPLGVVNLNQIIQRAVNPKSSDKNEIDLEKYTFREGDKVIHIKNNYDLGVFNGEVGVIRKILKSEDNAFIYVDYEDNMSSDNKRTVIYDIDTLSEIELAYCLTIHKSQGSESPCVLMPMDMSYKNLSRNILYTGITRARNLVTLIGDKKAVSYAIENNRAIVRNSRIQEKLINNKSVEIL